MMVKRMAYVGTCFGEYSSSKMWKCTKFPCSISIAFDQHCMIVPMIVTDVYRRRYTICGVALEQDWKVEAQAVIVTAAGLWFTVARLGDWFQRSGISQKPQVGTASAGGTATRKPKKLLGKSKAH